MGLFSSIGKFLFGEESRAVMEQKPLMTPEQLEILRRISSEILSSPSILAASATEPYTGQLVAPLTQQELTSLAALEQAVMNQVSGGSGSSKAQEILERLADVRPEEIESVYRSAIEQPLTTQFREQVIPELTRRFSGVAAFGSDRREQEAMAAERLARALASAKGELMARYRESAIDAARALAELAPRAEGARVEALEKLISASALPRSIEQARLLAEYEEFLRRQQGRQLRFEQAMSVLGQRPFENIALALPGSEGFLTGLARGAGAFLASKVLSSSESVKEKKQPIDHSKTLEAFEKLRVERWKYKPGVEDEEEHIGPYAEEFNKLFLGKSGATINIVDAVGVTMSAIKGLNYKLKALERAIQV